MKVISYIDQVFIVQGQKKETDILDVVRSSIWKKVIFENCPILRLHFITYYYLFIYELFITVTKNNKIIKAFRKLSPYLGLSAVHSALLVQHLLHLS